MNAPDADNLETQKTPGVDEGRSAARLVWLLVILELAVGLLVFLMINAALQKVQEARQNWVNAQTSTNLLIDGMDVVIPRARTRLESLVDGRTEPGVDDSFSVELHELLDSSRFADPGASEVIVSVRDSIDALIPIHRRLGVWTARTRANTASVDQAVKDVEAALREMRAAVTSAEGRESLKLAVLIQRFRGADAPAAAAHAREIVAALTPRDDLTEIGAELLSLALLCEHLLTVTDADHLVDLKDNQLAPSIFRVSQWVEVRSPATSEFRQSMAPLLAKLRDALLGRNHTADRAHQTLLPGEGGLYRLCGERLSLRREQDELRRTVRRAFAVISEKSMEMNKVLSAQIEGLSTAVETALAEGWRTMRIAGPLCAILFLGLALHIGGSINRQIRAIQSANQALADAVLEAQVAADSLGKSENRFRSLSASSPAGIMQMDAAGRCTYTNDRWLAISGQSAEKSAGQMWTIAVHPDDREAVASEWTASQKDGCEFSREFRVLAPSGDIRWIHLHSIALMSPDRKIAGHVATAEEVTERKAAEAKLEAAHQQLMLTSRRAGMAEVATGILHNIGNVLTSITTSATLVMKSLRESRIAHLAKTAELLESRKPDLPEFLAKDPRGKQLPEFLAQLADHLHRERDAMQAEMASLARNIDHIRNIIGTQQSYARVSPPLEDVALPEVIEDALRLNASSLARAEARIVRVFDGPGVIRVDKHRLLQILVNLVGNAKNALNEGGKAQKILTLKTEKSAEGRVRIVVTDNGIGITPDNLIRIFSHGFTTRKGGHGFGLHSSALAAEEMDGTLQADSDGPGQGATFTLDIPCHARPRPAPDSSSLLRGVNSEKEPTL